jgi:hypothetical protein
MSKIAPRGDTGRLAELIENHALERVPADQRKSGWVLAWSTTGIVTTLIQLLVITLILYPLLRVTILRPGTLTSRKPALTAGSQAAS